LEKERGMMISGKNWKLILEGTNGRRRRKKAR
jgi:hypothetical protein